MISSNQFDLIKYLAEKAKDANRNGGDYRILSLTGLSKEQGVSISYLREQLGVARAIGIVDVRPKTGINLLQYRFSPAVSVSLDYAIRLDRSLFYKFADLRSKLEEDYWYSALENLLPEDIELLNQIVEKALKKVNYDKSRVPHKEHIELHMTIFKRFDNPFVMGILESFWSAYERISPTVAKDQEYLVQMWDYHKQIVEAINVGDFEKSFHVMLFHMDFLGRNDI